MPKTIAAVLHEMVEAVCPIEGVSIGKMDDKATWKVSFHPLATDKQKADAALVIKQFDPSAEQSKLDVSETAPYDQNFRALVLALNDGSFVPGQKLSEDEIRTILKVNL